jgi:hypothetical protein
VEAFGLQPLTPLPSPLTPPSQREGALEGRLPLLHPVVELGVCLEAVVGVGGFTWQRATGSLAWVASLLIVETLLWGGCVCFRGCC